MNAQLHDVGLLVLASVNVTLLPWQMVVGEPVKSATGGLAAAKTFEENNPRP